MPVRAVTGRVSRSARRPLANATRLRGYSIPPPVKGWNARDSLASMDEADAIELVNWFPKESSVRVRNGFASHATGLGATVESLMSWTGPASSKLFGAADDEIFDVSSAGAVGAAAVSSLTSARWQHVMFSISSGSYLYIVNGADAPRYFDGSSWTAPTITGSGLNASDLIHINVFKRRIFLIEKDTLNFWYFPVETISGAITKFSLGPLADLGGYLVAMGTWTRDGGNGIDDYAVFVTSRGQAIIYQGTDPGDANAWSLVGVFRIGAPIGRRCMLKVGGDLIIITEDGFSQLSRFLAGARTSERAAMSDRISGAVKDAVDNHRTRFGWQPVFHPSGNMMLFNVPMGLTSAQFVSNSTTGAWCKFTNMNASCWEAHDNKLYFGAASGIVYQADTGLDDNGSDIETTVRSAFSYFGDRSRAKRLSMVRPNFLLDGVITVALRVNTDFENKYPDSTPSFTPGSGAEWDAADWDDADWGDAASVTRDWQAVNAIGHCASMALKTASQNGNIEWNSTDWLYEPTAGPGYL